MGLLLSYPLKSKALFRHGTEHLRVGGASMQGYRTEMEDSHQLIVDYNGGYFFGVYDGHCGSKASKFCSERIHKYVEGEGNFEAKSIQKAVMQADKDFLTESGGADDGTTAVFSIVQHREETKDFFITIGNVGDSRAMLITKSGEIFPLTDDHSPNVPEEAKRIKEAGGFVRNGRVNGNLAVSRAVGDRPYKTKDLAADKQEVIPLPDVTFRTASEGDILLLACDGIYEQMDNTAVGKYVYEQVQKQPDLAIVAANLCEKSLQSGSQDNMTALCVHFKDGTDVKPGNEFFWGPYYKDNSFARAWRSFAADYGFSEEEIDSKITEQLVERKEKRGAGSDNLVPISEAGN
mmetsp:Transcript_7793/g.8589  ORF Transcript_7793/g.8589 Transcript_7793/m.8589 type:complete len:348 (+) Transcript_7793:76-1119(+)